MTYHGLPARALALIILIAGVFGMASCGDSNDDADAGGNGATEAVSDEQAIKDVWKKLEAAVYARDGETYCAGISERMTREAISDSGRKTCVAAVRAAVDEPLTPLEIAKVKARVVSVRVRGDRALLATRGPDGGIDHRMFVKDGSEWRLDRYRLEAVPAPSPGERPEVR